MKIDSTELTADKLISIPNYVEELIERTGNPSISKGTVTYHIKEDTGKLDYTEIGKQIFIVRNDKSDNFTPGTNYKKTRTMSKQRLSR